MLLQLDAIFGRHLWLDILIVSLNLLLILTAKPILTRFSPEMSQDSGQFRFGLHLLRGVNVVIVLNLLYLNLWHASEAERSFLGKLVNVCFVVYLALFCSYLAAQWLLHRYGKRVERQGQTLYLDTYTSRLLSLISHALIGVLALVLCIQIAGFDSLLQATGVIGVIGVILAFTQGVWAPDLIAGILILHSDMLAEGDVIELHIEGRTQLLKVFKTRLFYTEFLNLVDHHRLMISNAKLRESVLHNLSKFASAKGLRECLRFKIGYDVSAARVQEMFEQAFEQAQKSGEQLGIEWQHGMEVQLCETGDHALEWAFYYRTKQVEQRVLLRQRMLLHIHQASEQADISLSTPYTHVVEQA